MDIESIISQHFKKVVWSNPVGKINHYFRLKQFGRANGELINTKIHLQPLRLPDNLNRYHLFQIGGLKPSEVNLKLTHDNKWYRFDKLAITKENMIEFVTSHGLLIPNEYCYVYAFENGMLIIAIRHLPNIVNLTDSYINIRITLNRQQGIDNIRSFDYDAGIYNTENHVDFDTTVEKYETCKGDAGYTFVHVNGVYLNRPDPYYTYQDGDVFSVWYDSTVKGYTDYPLKDAFSFKSKLDNVRKFLIHPFEFKKITYNYWATCNFIIGYKDSNGIFKGVELINDNGKKIRMVTDRSYAIPVSIFEWLIDNHPLFKGLVVDNLSIRIFYRQNGNALVVENDSHIQVLYRNKLLQNNVTGLLTGDLNGPSFWTCDNLENSSFCRIMRAKEESLIHEDYINTLDYYSYRALLFSDVYKYVNGKEVSIFINDEFYNYYKPAGLSYISNGCFNKLALGNDFRYTVTNNALGFETQIHTSLIVEPHAFEVDIKHEGVNYILRCPDHVYYKGKSVINDKPTLSNNMVSYIGTTVIRDPSKQVKQIYHDNIEKGNGYDRLRYQNAEKHCYMKTKKTQAWCKLENGSKKLTFNNTLISDELISTDTNAGEEYCVRLGNCGRFFYYDLSESFNGDAIVINAHEGFNLPYDIPFNRISIYAGEFEVNTLNTDAINNGTKLIEGIDYTVKWPYIHINTIDKLTFLNSPDSDRSIGIEFVDGQDYPAIYKTIKGLAVVIEGAVNSNLTYTPNDNYGFVVTINGKNYIQVEHYLSAIETSNDININIEGKISSINGYVDTADNLIFSKSKKCFLAIKDNYNTEVLKAGTPYEITFGLTDVYRNDYTLTEGLKKKSDERNVEILNILSNIAPDADIVLDSDIFINGWYRVYSPLIARLLAAIDKRELIINEAKINDVIYLESIIKDYQRYLDADPCTNEKILPFIVVYPTSINTIIGVDETTFHFISKINELYLNSKIEIKNTVTILKG